MRRSQWAVDCLCFRVWSVLGTRYGARALHSRVRKPRNCDSVTLTIELVLTVKFM